MRRSGSISGLDTSQSRTKRLVPDLRFPVLHSQPYSDDSIRDLPQFSWPSVSVTKGILCSPPRLAMYNRAPFGALLRGKSSITIGRLARSMVAGCIESWVLPPASLDANGRGWRLPISRPSECRAPVSGHAAARVLPPPISAARTPDPQTCSSSAQRLR